MKHQAEKIGDELIFAALSGDLRLVKKRLEDGADINHGNSIHATALHYASNRVNTDIVEFLLKSGANPDVRDNDGETPLHWAVLSGATDVITLLLDHGADPDIRDKNGRTADESARRFPAHTPLAETICHYRQKRGEQTQFRRNIATLDRILPGKRNGATHS